MSDPKRPQGLNTTSVIHLELDCEGCWDNLEETHTLEFGIDFHIAMVREGTVSGKTALVLRTDVNDGETTRAVVYQVSLDNLSAAVQAFRIREQASPAIVPPTAQA